MKDMIVFIHRSSGAAHVKKKNTPVSKSPERFECDKFKIELCQTNTKELINQLSQLQRLILKTQLGSRTCQFRLVRVARS